MGIGLVVGLMWIGCGLLLFAKREQNKHRYYTKYIMFFVVFGGIGVIGSLIHCVKLELTAIFLPTAVLCIFSFVYIKQQMNHCNTSVWGTYIQYHTYSAPKGRMLYTPVFQYTYQNKKYNVQTLDYRPLRNLLKNYTKGQSYEIFINPDKPECCFSRKKIAVGYYMIGLLGIVIFLSYLFLICFVKII